MSLKEFPHFNRAISRREFLKDSALIAAGFAGFSAGANSLLAQSQRVWAATPPRSAKDTIVIGWDADVGTLDAGKTEAGHEQRYNVQVFETMVRLEGGSPEIKPSLGIRRDISADGKEWTFTVRPGVRFHDGTPLKAQDIQWSYDRWRDPKHPFHDPPYGNLPFAYAALDEVRAIDDTTIKFFLKRVDAAFESNMLFPAAGIVNPEAVKKLGKQGFAQHPVGTGPWKVVEWIKGTRLILERNGDHWGNPPILQRMIIKPIAEDAIRLAQLKTGEVDIVVALPPQFVPAVQGDPNLQLLETVGNHIWWIALNTREKPFSDKRVRQAVNYAVDKDVIVNQLLKGAAAITPGPMIAGSWPEDKTLKPYPHDPRRAKQLLEAAGYGGGFDTRFWVPESGSGMIAPKEIATLVQAQLKEVGINVEIVTQEWTSYVAQYGSEGFAPKGKQSFGMGELSTNGASPDPALGSYLPLFVTTASHPPKGWNGGFYSNPEVDGLLEQAARTLDREQRKRLYVRAQRIMYDDAPWIFMFSAKNLVAARKNIRGLEVNPNPWWLDLTRTYVEA